MMRTTIVLPDDVHRVARSLAHAKGISLGEAVAELVRKGLAPTARVQSDKPFPCFQQDPSARPITLEETLRAEDEL